MSAIPGDVDTDSQPPMTVPLRHFLVAVAFLPLGALAGVAAVADVRFGLLSLAHLHLLLVGWVCVTIAGAMTQFVPVWSGVSLHSTRLASLQLPLLAGGLLGFAGSLLAARLALFPVFGAVMLLGFWLFVYNVGRTLVRARPFDTTERHFALALGFFVLAPALGLLLAVDFTHPLLAGLAVTRPNVVAAHATLAVFGAVLTTVLGALYQLGTMFTQTELHGIDDSIRRFEELGYPVGVLLLAGGRLFGSPTAACLGGVLVCLALLGFAVVLARRLWETAVDRTPMLSRYTVVAAATALWAALALPAWLVDPLARRALLGAPETGHLLLLGVVGFVVLGTLYHVVPFVVWVHRYSDRLGYEPVPMVDDLYDDRLAVADFWSVLGGSILLVAGDAFDLPSVVSAVGGVAVLVGSVLFVANVVGVVREHAEPSFAVVVLGSWTAGSEDGTNAPVDGD
jgi:cbb3-type cytochrome oxidase subunit 1